ncbi:hypothetical protein MmmBen468_0135 [Mycoplasma mycoides subsp. mycoides]|uniref:Uncharacterized protein n=2 Tax=Mycoplasma mycoides subsp. mycoides TaxID=2103 RepID=Q6MUA9_MYCMS|nr:conserved hypothetical protein [Mycoplasma mycoides subsp. mycoides SC str. Gladysdale]AIZ54972.1 hypothetical protein mycmycITA_00141 [Mycoplasma mycoides subsp. mycoides]CAE76775.1 Hypothetical protein MSC_0126 [Mycoplasma mycoides subsp. mycoides SC str. PG1]AME10334.1 hypothetical protein MmmBen_0130 [Mycoplasma mycoides subsp. mycoides]AME14389.1 hypothetical protein MmmBen468_0135 [Mycoplasma mycoides subsp. mycoides]
MKIFKQYKKVQIPDKPDIWYLTGVAKKNEEIINKVLYS